MSNQAAVTDFLNQVESFLKAGRLIEASDKSAFEKFTELENLTETYGLA